MSAEPPSAPRWGCALAGGHRQELRLVVRRLPELLVEDLESRLAPATAAPRSCSNRRRSVLSRVTLANPTCSPCLVVHGGDQHGGPEPGPVLADAPTLLLVVADPQRRLGSCSGCFRPGPGRIEDTEVLADDLVGGVALAALCPAVPADDVPARIEHEDGVVLDRLDEQPEAFLAAAELLGRSALGRHVLHLEEEVQRAAVGVPTGASVALTRRPPGSRRDRARTAPRRRLVVDLVERAGNDVVVLVGEP